MAKAKPGSSPSTPRKMAAKPAMPAAVPRGKATAAAAPAKARGNGQPAQPPQVVMTMSHDEIARKAYEIWLAKGRPYGQDDQNWREAEASLQTQTQRA